MLIKHLFKEHHIFKNLEIKALSLLILLKMLRNNPWEIIHQSGEGYSMESNIPGRANYDSVLNHNLIANHNMILDDSILEVFS